MAPEKRKSDGTAHKAANKRPKTEPATKEKPPAADQDKPKKPKASSVLTKEQPAFPRGGASLLTPLERKQIRAKAAQDADDEDGPSHDLFGNAKAEADSEEGSDAEVKTRPAKLDKKRRTDKKAASKTANGESEVQIGGLSHKRLATGSLVLGQVVSINARALTISLPNNLVGYVPITAISPQLSQKIQTLLEKDDQDDARNSDEEDQEDDDIALTTYFQIGQYVRVAVTSTGQDVPGTKPSARKRIELSLEPELTNAGVSGSSLVPGVTVQAFVSSVEDHGLVVELGLEADKIRGFVPKKELPAGTNLSDVKTGTVFLCHVLQLAPNNKVVKLSANLATSAVLKSAPSVDTFLPGSKVEILISNVTDVGLAGKVMGILDVTADVVHSGSFRDRQAFLAKFQVGMKAVGRLICNFPLAEEKKLGCSVLQHLLDLDTTTIMDDKQEHALPISSTLDSATVIHVEPGLGVYLQLDEKHVGFAHISRLSDKRVESISETTGPYKLGTEHKARVLEHNPIDSLYVMSLQKSVFEQPFLRYQDVQLGAVVKGKVEKLVIGVDGVQGLLVTLAEGVTGYVPAIHMSDIKLEHPEKKFKEGQTVTARVLTTNANAKRIHLSLKKTLVNSDQKIWSGFTDIAVGDSTVGVLIKVVPAGAVVRFFGPVKGFLPVSEMSEAYIKDATEHFRVGQVLTVNAINIDQAAKKLTLSCRNSSASNHSVETTMAALQPGSLVSGTVFEKSKNDVLLRLEDSEALARLTTDHVCDGSLKKRESALSKIRVGQKLDGILVLQVQSKRRLVLVSNKKSLVKAAEQGTFLKTFEQLKPDALLTGYITNITEDGIFVSFAAGITGLIPKDQVGPDHESQPDFGMKKLQVASARVHKIDYKGVTPRFWLTMRDSMTATATGTIEADEAPDMTKVKNPIDTRLLTVADLLPGKVTKAKIVSIKDTQINVDLAEGIQGRIDVSEVFDDWKDIKDRKHPLQRFSTRQELSVRVLGAHDTRNHRFLPLTHRKGKNTVYELSCKPSTVASPKLPKVTLHDTPVGSSHLAFINNISDHGVWVNMSPTIRGRIRATDLSDDLSLAADLTRNFPLGSALRVRVLAVDPEKGHLDLTARSDMAAASLTFASLSPGLVLPGKVTKVTDRNIIVQLSEQVVGSVELIDMADSYEEANPAKYTKNDVVRVCVVSVDAPNKRIVLSTRPSKVLSSSMQAQDKEITSVKQLKVNEIIRGFVKNVSDKGVFVTLGHGIDAFVRVGHLSDDYLKEWKDSFQRDQLVKGRLTLVDDVSGHVQMTLKQSALKDDYQVPITFNDLKVGDIVTGKVASIEKFGVFVLVDNSERVRGLCHRSEIAEQRVEDVSKLFNEGDKVKAKVLKIDAAQRRVNFGMKASYFGDIAESGDEDENDDEHNDSDVDMADPADDGDESMEDEDRDPQSDDSEEGVDLDIGKVDAGLVVDSDDNASDRGGAELSAAPSKSQGLSVGGFDWTGTSSAQATSQKRSILDLSESEDEGTAKPASKKPKKRHTNVAVNYNELNSVESYEANLASQADTALFWLQWMSHHLELGEISAARRVGERALAMINNRLQSEKFKIWSAMLTLEIAHGDDTTMEHLLERALQVNDKQEIYTKLVSLYIGLGKYEKATETFETMMRLYPRDAKIYTNFATFLFDKVNNPDKARSLLQQGLPLLHDSEKCDFTLKFASMEFKSGNGVPERGRTLFEGMLNAYPKRLDLWDVLLDLEGTLPDNEEQVRAVFGRIFDGERKLKPKKAKGFFKRWVVFEEKMGNERRVEDVKGRAALWVREHGKGE